VQEKAKLPPEYRSSCRILAMSVSASRRGWRGAGWPGGRRGCGLGSWSAARRGGPVVVVVQAGLTNADNPGMALRAAIRAVGDGCFGGWWGWTPTVHQEVRLLLGDAGKVRTVHCGADGHHFSHAGGGGAEMTGRSAR